MTEKSVYGGLFQDPTYISTDPDPKKTDPFDKQDFIPSRYLGKSLLSSRPPPGTHADAFFAGKFLTLASADQNEEGEALRNTGKKKKKKEAQKHEPPQVSDKVFVATSFPQKSTGPGSFYGCFQSRPFEYMTEPWMDPKEKKKKHRNKKEKPKAEENQHLPNIKTNPSKKGTFGVPGTLLDNPQYNDQWKDELAAIDKLEAKRNKGKRPPPKPIDGPFRVSGVCHPFIDEHRETGAHVVYDNYVPPPVKVKNKKKDHKKDPAEVKSIHEKPFQRSTSHRGEQGNINPFPNVWVDPAEMKAMEKKKKRTKKSGSNKGDEVNSGRLKNAPEWKSNSAGKTSIISSCLRKFY